jgi:putative ABC transport system permease protein
LRRAIAAAAPGVELATASSFDTYMQGPLAQPRLNAFLLAVFAASALILAAIGLFGVVATTVRQRSHELGVRMALGATAADIRSLILKKGLAIAIAGVAIGISAALLTNRVLVALLYDVSPTDPRLLLGVGLFLTIVAVLASLLPAQQSGRIDPAVALRADV